MGLFFFFFLSSSGVHQVRVPQQTVWKRPSAANVFLGNTHFLSFSDITNVITWLSELIAKIIMILSFPAIEKMLTDIGQIQMFLLVKSNIQYVAMTCECFTCSMSTALGRKVTYI